MKKDIWSEGCPQKDRESEEVIITWFPLKSKEAEGGRGKYNF